MRTTSRHTIIVVNDHASIVGGAAKVAICSAVELARRGHDVVFYSGVGPVDESLQNVPNLQVECLFQYDILRDPNRMRAVKTGLWNRAAAKGLTRIIERHRHQSPIVHCHPWVKALSPSVFAAIQVCGAPSVITLHDYFLACPTGGFLDSKTGQVCTRTPLSLSCIGCNCDPRNYYHKLWRVVRGFVQRDIAHCPSHCKNFIAVSPFSQKVLSPFLPTNANVDLIRYPIEVDREEAIDPGRREDFLFVGRFSPEKGALDLARAVVATGLRAVFVGQGDQEQQIRAACPQATFLGWQSPAEVLQRMRHSRALVFPSRWYETQGLVAIEACAVGLPVIYSDATVIASDLQHDVTGLSYQAGNSEDLARVMLRLANDVALARRLGSAAYSWYWNDPWTLDRHVTRLEELYDRIRSDGGSLAN